jgi:hypothetical protein
LKATVTVKVRGREEAVDPKQTTSKNGVPLHLLSLCSLEGKFSTLFTWERRLNMIYDKGGKEKIFFLLGGNSSTYTSSRQGIT